MTFYEEYVTFYEEYVAFYEYVKLCLCSIIILSYSPAPQSQKRLDTVAVRHLLTIRFLHALKTSLVVRVARHYIDL